MYFLKKLCGKKYSSFWELNFMFLLYNDKNWHIWKPFEFLRCLLFNIFVNFDVFETLSISPQIKNKWNYISLLNLVKVNNYRNKN